MKVNKPANYFYGPVLSRRLGFSLGVDLLPGKVCTFECCYCQVGKTDKNTMRRFSWVDIKLFGAQLRQMLKRYPHIEHITIAGSGEPTLHKNLDTIINAIQSIVSSRIPVVLITNSSLLYRSQVRKEILSSSIIIPSLDAPNEVLFRKITSAKGSVSFSSLVKGLIALRQEYTGQLWLEIMLVKGINDSIACAREFLPILRKVNPDKVHLNLPQRPSLVSDKMLVPTAASVDKYAKVIGGTVEVVSEANVPLLKTVKGRRDIEAQVIDSLSRRPQTIEELAVAINCSHPISRKIVNALFDQGVLRKYLHAHKTYYSVRND